MPSTEPPTTSIGAKRHISAVEDSVNPSKKPNTNENSILSVLICVENELARRRNVKEKLFTNWAKESIYTSCHSGFTSYLSLECKVGFLPPVADPSLCYVHPKDDEAEVPWSEWLKFVDSVHMSKLGIKNTVERIAVSLFQKYQIPVPWCSLLLPVLVTPSRYVSPSNRDPLVHTIFPLS
jgi:hypothetical protein